MPSKVFDNTRPLSDDEDVGFEPMEFDEPAESVTVVWGDDMIPIQWLFAKRGRGDLVTYAMREVADGDPIFNNKSALGEAANVSRHSCHRHIDDLVNLGVYEKLDKPNSNVRYRPNTDSQILRALYTANREIEEYGPDPT